MGFTSLNEEPIFLVLHKDVADVNTGSPAPAFISSGLQMWLDASDASTMTLTGDRVDEWRDKNGGALKVQTANGLPTSFNPTLTGGSVFFYNKYLDSGSAFPMDWTAGWTIMAVINRSEWYGAYFVADGGIPFGVSSFFQGERLGNGTYCGSSEGAPRDVTYVHGQRWDSGAFSYGRNEDVFPNDIGGIIPETPPFGVLQIGGLIGSAAYGRFSAQAFFFWNRPLTNSEWKQMSLWVRNHYSVATLPAPTFNIVVDGNSLALGYFSLNYCCMNAGIIAANGSPGQTGYVNKAESGAATSVLLADAATRVDPLYKSKGKFSIIIFWEGTNDIGNNLTDVQAYTNIKNYCIGRKAAGWNKTIVGTILPRNGSPNPSFEATRISVNSMIRAAKAANESWLDAVADIGGDSNLQTPSDTTYYSDGLHLTDSGHILATPYITAAINAVTA